MGASSQGFRELQHPEELFDIISFFLGFLAKQIDLFNHGSFRSQA
jgi:hypothetical protein